MIAVKRNLAPAAPPPKAGGGTSDVVGRRDQALASPEATPKRAQEAGAYAAIIGLAAARFRVDAAVILSRRHHKRVVRARYVAIYLVTRLTGDSFMRIGRAFGRHHATVIHAVRKIEELMERDARWRGEIERLMAVVAGAEIDRLVPVAAERVGASAASDLSFLISAALRADPVRAVAEVATALRRVVAGRGGEGVT